MRLAVYLFLVSCCAGSLRAELLRAEETPLFSRHVVAAISKLGCNGGTCHGAVQGKNDFRLSLFGAKPAADYTNIVRHLNGRRLDPFDTDRSLLLQKPSGRVPHGGGKILSQSSPEYRLLRDW